MGLMRVLVMHHEPAEASRLAERLRREGVEPEVYQARGTSGFRRIGDNPPDAILFDLARMPSFGRMMGGELRKRKGTQAIPLVFLEGDPEKTNLVREWLPDATFTTLRKLRAAVAKAIEPRSTEPVTPQVEIKSAARKLGIRENAVVAMLHAPAGFALEALPVGVRIQKSVRGAGCILLFARSAAALGRELGALKIAVEAGCRLWVIWPKRTSGATGDLSLPLILEMSKQMGLSPYKTCAIDEKWSGMAVGRRRDGLNSGV
jgi:CheY-like chemotaxis protein